MIARVQISGSYLSDTDSGNWYTFDINPSNFDDQDSWEVNVGRTLNGYSFEMLPQFDGRPKTMRWENLPNRSPYTTLVSNLKLLKGKETYIRLRDLSKSENNSEEQLIRIIKVKLSRRQSMFKV